MYRFKTGAICKLVVSNVKNKYYLSNLLRSRIMYDFNCQQPNLNDINDFYWIEKFKGDRRSEDDYTTINNYTKIKVKENNIDLIKELLIFNYLVYCGLFKDLKEFEIPLSFEDCLKINEIAKRKLQLLEEKNIVKVIVKKQKKNNYFLNIFYDKHNAIVNMF